MTKIRLLLVDDHTVVRAGLRALFDQQSDMEVVAEAESTASALRQADEVRPDVVLLDLTLPGSASLDVIPKLLEMQPPPRILVLTMHDDPRYARSALADGATGYVVKTISEQDLLAAVRTVYRGKMVVDLDDEDKNPKVFGPGGPGGRSKAAAARAKLSERELEVLRLLGQGYTNQSIAEQLDISPKTVATYRARIGEKLDLKTTAEFVRYATDTGLLAGRDRFH